MKLVSHASCQPQAILVGQLWRLVDLQGPGATKSIHGNKEKMECNWIENQCVFVYFRFRSLYIDAFCPSLSSTSSSLVSDTINVNPAGFQRHTDDTGYLYSKLLRTPQDLSFCLLIMFFGVLKFLYGLQEWTLWYTGILMVQTLINIDVDKYNMYTICILCI